MGKLGTKAPEIPKREDGCMFCGKKTLCLMHQLKYSDKLLVFNRDCLSEIPARNEEANEIIGEVEAELCIATAALEEGMKNGTITEEGLKIHVGNLKVWIRKLCKVMDNNTKTNKDIKESLGD